MKFKTLILRFRDLSTITGDTIRYHTELINSKTEVWWGWWAKAGEKIPSAFSDIQSRLKDENSIEVYLFDSGQSKLYVANLKNIIFDSRRIASPNKDITPKYYGDSTYQAWFLFDSISEVNSANVESIINGFSYSGDVSDFFDDGVRFNNFVNKQISSLNELKYQDRTIWFVREYDEVHDETHEIILCDAHVSIPEVFKKNHIKTHSKKLLWLSDVHFGIGDSEHGFETDESIQLATIIEKYINDEAGNIDGLIISGDMTWRSLSEEFDLVERFYKHLNSTTSLKMERIGFCPGNHDVSFSDIKDPDTLKALKKLYSMQTKISSRTKLNKSERESLKAIKLTGSASENYKKHFKNVVGVQPNEFLSMGNKYLVAGQRSVEICFLNSNSLQQHSFSFQGHGFVGRKQMEHAEKEMGWGKQNNKIYGGTRIVVLHHNLLPVTYCLDTYIGEQVSMIYDSQAIITWCYENDVDIILHGHTHERSIKKLTQVTDDNHKKSLWIIGLGSSGAHSSHLVPGTRNEFAEFDFSEEMVKVTFKEIKIDRVCDKTTTIELN